MLVLFKVKKLTQKFIFSFQEEGWKSALQKTRRKLLNALRSPAPSGWEELIIEGARIVEPRALVMPSSETPIVSIIIPVYNQFRYTFNCLESIASTLDNSLSFEVIVVDDASTDGTEERLTELVTGIRRVSNIENSGFIRSCHRGAGCARGKYLYFLNNDTRLLPGCIESLLAAIEDDPTVGAVGSKLIYSNGRLQEAGGIVWNSADGWNYGRLDYPDEPEYNYVRPVDYCSGASLLVRVDLWRQSGGFSETFLPAYYEDTDLCFAIRELGYKVLYQPASQVIHYEGISSGTSLTEGVKRYQVVNQGKFRDKWEGRLKEHLDNDPGNVPRAARRWQGKPTILVIDTYVPLYDRESGCVRLFNIVKILLDMGFSVIFFPDNGYPEQPYTSTLQQMGVEVVHGTSRNNDLEGKLLARLPLIDVVWLCRPELCDKYMDLIRSRKEVPIVYDTIDLHFLRLKRQGEYLDDSYRGTGWSWETYRKLELKFAREASATVVVTEDERQTLLSMGVANASVIPNVHSPSPASGITPFEERSGLVFIGSYNHPPNIDAVKWLCSEIMPLIWRSRPEVTVTLLGSNLKKEVEDLAGERVIVTGYVERVEPYFARSRVFVAPLRFGAGMKGKIGQSMSVGLPTVTTTIGAEGMGLSDRRDVLIADTAEDFAGAVLELYDGRELWETISRNSLESIERFSPGKVRDRLVALFSSLAVRPPG